MRLALAGLVYRKELRETLRDRRTLVVMVLLPLALYPLVGYGISQWVGSYEAARVEQVSCIGLVGPSWPALLERLRASPRLTVVEQQPAGEQAQSAAGQVLASKLDAALKIPVGYQAQLQRGQTVAVELIYDQTRAASQLAKERLDQQLAAWGEQLRRERLAAHGLPASILRPLDTRAKSVASPAQVKTHLLAGVLPLLIVLMVLLGAFYPAIDLTAGEKERGTLETLLASPVSRTSLMAGKYLAVATIAAATGLLNLGSIALTIGLGFGPALREAGLSGGVPWSALLLTLLALVPAALFFAGLMIAVAALARSFKEAQNLLTPVYLACMIPALAAQLPGFELNALSALIPVAGISLLLRALIEGQLQPWPLVLALVSTALYTALALRAAAAIYTSERLLFAARDPARRRPGNRRSAPQPAEAGIVFLVVLALLLLVGQPLQARSLVSGLLVTEWLLIALPVVALVRVARLDGRAVLALRRPTWRALAGALLTGLSAWYLVGVLVETVQQRFLPMPRQMMEEAQRLLFAADRPLALDLFVLALSPAICEELLFRGLLLRSTRFRFTTGGVLLLNGLLFALFHLNIYRFLPTFLLGVMLTLIVLRTGSIFPAMLFHLLNNAAAVLAGRFLTAEAAELQPASLLYGAVAAVSFGLGLLLILRHRPPGSPARSDPAARPGPAGPADPSG